MNARNALGVAALARRDRACRCEGAVAALAELPRRPPPPGGGRAKARGITVIDDFAHHPTAVAGTLAALRARYPRRACWALFEPRSNTTPAARLPGRVRDAFAGADRVRSVPCTGGDPIPRASGSRSTSSSRSLAARGVPARDAARSPPAIALLVARQARAGRRRRDHVERRVRRARRQAGRGTRLPPRRSVGARARRRACSPSAP